MTTHDDAALLKRFEPVLQFTSGESFYPCSVEDYLQHCGLWVKQDKLPAQNLIPAGALDLDMLAQQETSAQNAVYYLQFISPLTLKDLALYQLQKTLHKEKKNRFKRQKGRLSRVGYFSRFADALFSFSLLIRGRVPGDASSAAVIQYQKKLEGKNQHPYYGRVIKTAGWVVLQYWYFYAFNNWRSGFYGANDHEADWEMVNIYLEETEAGDCQPVWVAYASHEFKGDDLRRRWDDDELEKVGEHPVVYVGAGSHASYFSKGEYLTSIELPFLTPVQKFIHKIEALWSKVINENDTRSEEDRMKQGVNVFRIPFVDYARGDGVSIGADAERTWADPVLLDDAALWAHNYRGLWGLYAQDPFSGENAPAGPRYNRDGSVRKAWFDPLGWAGMEKVTPPAQMLMQLHHEIKQVRRNIEQLKLAAKQKQADVLALGLRVQSVKQQMHMKPACQRMQNDLESQTEELAQVRQALSDQKTLLQALQNHAADLAQGISDHPRAHIKHAHHPQTDEDVRWGVFSEIWSAVSIGVMMITLVVLFIFLRQYFWYGVLTLLGLMIVLESAFRRRLVYLINSLATALVILVLLILLKEFYWLLIIALALIAGAYMVIENLRELLS